MQALELKIPPPIVMVLTAAAMWVLSLYTPLLELPAFIRISAALAIGAIGVGFSVAGVLSFRRAKTTVNPMKPETASSLVSSGIYGVTRNPMYVGLLFVLIGWAVFLSSAYALVGALAFLLYITRFQIQPEERVLSRVFGSDYTAYKAKVRRWL
jgi:protein-S-isoprenylcysteine O-methyltransferase Ste14